mgnify:FL=1
MERKPALEAYTMPKKGKSLACFFPSLPEDSERRGIYTSPIQSYVEIEKDVYEIHTLHSTYIVKIKIF